MSTPAIEGMREMSSPPSRSGAVTLTSDFDVTSLFGGDAATQIYVETGGTIYFKLLGDSAFISMVVGDKTYHVGRFKTIGGTGTGTTASGIKAFSY